VANLEVLSGRADGKARAPPALKSRGATPLKRKRGCRVWKRGAMIRGLLESGAQADEGHPAKIRNDGKVESPSPHPSDARKSPKALSERTPVRL
jgi:hypothetical protein